MHYTIQIVYKQNGLTILLIINMLTYLLSQEEDIRSQKAFCLGWWRVFYGRPYSTVDLLLVFLTYLAFQFLC